MQRSEHQKWMSFSHLEKKIIDLAKWTPPQASWSSPCTIVYTWNNCFINYLPGQDNLFLISEFFQIFFAWFKYRRNVNTSDLEVFRNKINNCVGTREPKKHIYILWTQKLWEMQTSLWSLISHLLRLLFGGSIWL